MKTKQRLFLTLTAALVLMAWGLSPALAADQLVLGYSMAKTGPYVSLAKSNEVAADMAVDEINAKGGVNGKKLKLVKFDTSGDPKQAAVAVRKFAKDDNALAVIGPFSSSEAGVAFKVGEKLGIVQMPMASSKPKLAAPYMFGFRNTTNEVITVTAVMKTLRVHGYPAKTASIAHGTDDAISKAMGTIVFPLVLKKKFGVEIVNVVTFKVKGTFDLSAQVSQLMTKPTDLVAVGAPPEHAIILAKECGARGTRDALSRGQPSPILNYPSGWVSLVKGLSCRRYFLTTSTTRRGSSPQTSPSVPRLPGLSALCRASSMRPLTTSSIYTPKP